MDFNDNPKEAEFRSQVREFLDQNAQKRSDVSLTGSSAGAPETVRQNHLKEYQLLL